MTIHNVIKKGIDRNGKLYFCKTPSSNKLVNNISKQEANSMNMENELTPKTTPIANPVRTALNP